MLISVTWTLDNESTTYDPENPPPEAVNGDNISGVLDAVVAKKVRARTKHHKCNHSQVRNEEDRQTECRVVAKSDETEHPEERLHHKICHIVEQVECEETAGRTVQPRQEVDDDVKVENPEGGERDIGKQVGHCDSRWSIEAVLRLESKFVSLVCWSLGFTVRTCFLRMGRPII